jgi:hypothetical protein
MENIDKRCLNSIGFFESSDPFIGKVWTWGKYTASNAFEHKFESPILSWDPRTFMMHVHPMEYKKKITSFEGFQKIIEAVNFLISTES